MLHAPAKVNLALSVGPPLRGGASDGYHPIASWMAPIDLCDELHVTRLEEDRLSRYAIVWHEDAPRKSPIDWSITKDLAVRAHLLLQEHTGRTLPVQMKLTKRIPVGGGLGGGSSDAAAMLRAVVQLHELEIEEAKLRDLAMKLGSDVAFFLGDGPMVVEGLGEQLSPAAHAGGAVVLLFPEFGCPTGAVYRAYDASPVELRAERVRAMAAAGSIDTHSLFNDLAAPAEAVAPGLAELRSRASRITGRPVHVTGSGSTLFALAADEAEARSLRATLEHELSACAAVCAALAAKTKSEKR